MDGLMLHSLVREWQKFIGHRIDKIHQPTPRELVFALRARVGTTRVLLSAHRRFFRAHELQRQRPPNPQEPPMFCMLARKYLEGGRIVKIEQQGIDRVLEIHVDSVNEVGDSVVSVLILELMGKHSNLIICTTDENGQPAKVIDSIVRVSSDMSRVRPILPGLSYTRPPRQDKVAVPNLNAEHLSRLDWSLPHVKLAKKIPVIVAGVGPTTAQEALHRATLQASGPARDSTPPLANDVVLALKAIYTDLLAGSTEPTVGLDELGRPVAAAPFQLTFCPTTESFTSYDEALEDFYSQSAVQIRTSALHQELTTQLEQALDRLRGKQEKLKQELAKGKLHEEERIKGELLTAYAAEVEKGQEFTSLPNYYEDNELLRIDLDPAKTPMENAQNYFRRASKRKRALTLLDQELTAVQRDLDYLGNCLLIAEDAKTSDMEALQEELVQQGFLKVSRRKREHKGSKSGRKTQSTKIRPNLSLTQLRSSDGFLVLIGRNNAQNDWLTFRKSQPDDLWLHVKDQPGSHVVVRTSGQTVPDTTLDEAATLAAYYSKGRDSSKVAVDYTLVRHVWKPNGARPGFALYKEQKTLFVTPNRGVVKQLQEKAADADA